MIRYHRRDKQENQQAGSLAGDVLILEIIHEESASPRSYQTRVTGTGDTTIAHSQHRSRIAIAVHRQNDTLGASRSLGDSISKSWAGANPASVAITEAGNTSRWVL